MAHEGVVVMAGWRVEVGRTEVGRPEVGRAEVGRDDGLRLGWDEAADDGRER